MRRPANEEDPFPTRSPSVDQLIQLDQLVERADPSTINWLTSHYDINAELTTAYGISILVDYFKYYDGKKRNTNGTR